LRADPEDQRVRDLQVDAAMLWLQNFRVLAGEGQKVEDLAGPRLAELMTVLQGGLSRTNGKDARAADILAHLGWAHWLNQRMAYKEFGPAAERDLRQALAVDPGNVYAHAMLGNWLLQRRGDVNEALRHFDAALQTGKQRPLIRSMQLGGMLHNDAPGVRQALIRALDQMRREGEPLDDGYRRRVVSAYNATVNSAEELTETLSAVPPDDAWATFLWLHPKAADGGDEDGTRIRHAFIHASLEEIRGRRPEAVSEFQNLERELKAKGYTGRILNHVSGAIRRLSP
jgi:tetratricopeptide (TPR) repeat protein